jgi:hypothetical protein
VSEGRQNANKALRLLDQLAERREHRWLELRALDEAYGPDRRRLVFGDIALTGDPGAAGIAADRPPARMPKVVRVLFRAADDFGGDLSQLPVAGRRLLQWEVLVVGAPDRALGAEGHCRPGNAVVPLPPQSGLGR